MNNGKPHVDGIGGLQIQIRAHIHAPTIASFCLLAFLCAAPRDRGDAD